MLSKLLPHNVEHQLTNIQVEEHDKIILELAIEDIVCVIDGAQTGICVVIGIDASTKWPSIPIWRGLPVIIVMGETVYLEIELTRSLRRRLFEPQRRGMHKSS